MLSRLLKIAILYFGKRYPYRLVPNSKIHLSFHTFMYKFTPRIFLRNPSLLSGNGVRREATLGNKMDLRYLNAIFQVAFKLILNVRRSFVKI